MVFRWKRFVRCKETQSFRVCFNRAHNRFPFQTLALIETGKQMSRKSSSREVTTDDGASYLHSSASEMEDVGKYFLDEVENGKHYSICLVRDCCRRFEGSNIDELKTHLSVAHCMELNSTSVACPEVHVADNLLRQSKSEEEIDLSELVEVSDDDAEGGLSALSNDGANETILPEEPDEVSGKPIGVFDYFRIFTEGRRTYAKCLVGDCTAKLMGEHSGNLRKHLRKHNINPTSTGKKRKQPKLRLKSNFEQSNVHDYFKIIYEDGFRRPKCLVNGCDFVLANYHAGNMRKHLSNSHKMGVMPVRMSNAMPTEANPDTLTDMEDGVERSNPSIFVRKYFKKVRRNFKLYSKCMIKDCDNYVPGENTDDLLMHLQTLHDMDQLELRKDDSIRRPNGIPFTWRYFRMYTEKAEIRSECLLCHTHLRTQHRGNLNKHLRNHHREKFSSFCSASNDPKNRLKEMAKYRKLFRIINNDGRWSTKCLVLNCDKTAPGRGVTNMREHLRKCHNQIFRKIESECREPETDDIHVQDVDGIEPFTTPTGVDPTPNANLEFKESISPKIDSSQKEMSHEVVEKLPPKLRNQRNLQKTKAYFRPFTVNGQVFNECLVEGCSRRLRGHHLGNLTKHLVTMHDITDIFLSDAKDAFDTESIGIDDDGTDTQMSDETYSMHTGDEGTPIEENKAERIEELETRPTTSNASSAHSPNSDKMLPPNVVREYFRFVDANGTIRSECLIDGCATRVLGKNDDDMKAHMQKMHAPVLSKRRLSARDYFRTTMEGDEICSQCLVDSCGSKIRGTHVRDLASHLQKTHDIIVMQSAPAQRYKCTAAVRAQFKLISENGEWVSICLVCNKRLNGKHTGNLKKHLVNRHGMLKTNANCSDAGTSKSINADSNASESGGDSSRPGGDPFTNTAQKYFRIIVKSGKSYSSCRKCNQVLKGSQLNHMKRHLSRAHNIEIAHLKNSDTVFICRLCFDTCDRGLHIFNSRMNIADVIRTHFSSIGVNFACPLVQHSLRTHLSFIFSLSFSLQVSEDDELPNFLCRKCSRKLMNFHEFYQDTNRATEKYLANRATQEPLSGSNDVDEMMMCKNEPPDETEFDADSQPSESTFGIDSMCDFDDEEFEPEATIDQCDFDKIFIEEFATDVDMKKERMASDDSDVMYEPGSSSGASTRRSKRIKLAAECSRSPKTRAESTIVESFCKYCGDSFASTDELDIHYKDKHIMPN